MRTTAHDLIWSATLGLKLTVEDMLVDDRLQEFDAGSVDEDVDCRFAHADLVWAASEYCEHLETQVVDLLNELDHLRST